MIDRRNPLKTLYLYPSTTNYLLNKFYFLANIVSTKYTSAPFPCRDSPHLVGLGLAALGNPPAETLEVLPVGGEALQGLAAGLVRLRGALPAGLQHVGDERVPVGGEALHGDARALHHVGRLEALSLGCGPRDEVILEGGGTAELAGGRLVAIFGLG